MRRSLNLAMAEAGSERNKTCCCSVTIRSAVYFISRILVPVIIGFFTVIIAIYQQNATQSDRDKDIARAAELRKQDLELARLQREEDRETARLQQAEDREIARARRELDLQLAKDKRLQEYELAEGQMNLSKSQREHEFRITQQNRVNDLTIADENIKENILVKFQRDLTTLLMHYQHTAVESDETLQFILQMKTRAALRLLDPSRRTVVLRNIKQAGILDTHWKSSKAALFNSNVSGVDFSSLSGSDSIDYFLIYDNLDIEMSDGRFAILRGITVSGRLSFAFSNFDYADWSHSQLRDVMFQKFATMNHAKFTGTRLNDVSFYQVEMNHASFQRNIFCAGCIFLEASLEGVQMDYSTFQHSSFALLSMDDSNMSHAAFQKSDFANLSLDRVDLSGAHFLECRFTNVSMVNCSLSTAIFKSTFFSHVNLNGCKGFTNEQLSTLRGSSQVTLPNGTVLKPKP